MINDYIKAKGDLRIVLTDSEGRVKFDKEETNVVTNLGKDYIASRMVDTSIPSQMSHMAVGTSGAFGSEAVTDTALVAEIARVALTGVEGTPSTNTVQYIATFPAGTGTGALVEAGILNDGTVGTMLCRTTYNVVNKGVDDTLTITWTITIS